MKGTNTLKLNQATVNQALQQWADSTFHVTGLKVTDVKQTSSPVTEFEVTLVSKDQD